MSAPPKQPTVFKGKVARGRPSRKRVLCDSNVDTEQSTSKPKRRQSDGRRSRALRVYYLRESTEDEEIRKEFRRFGDVRFYRRDVNKQFAFVVFDKVGQASAAKKALEHSRPQWVLCHVGATTTGFCESDDATGVKIDYVAVEVAQPDKTPTLEYVWTGKKTVADVLKGIERS